MRKSQPICLSQTQIVDQYFQLRSNKSFPSLSPTLCSAGVSSEGSCGRRLSAGHQYSRRLCLLWCGQKNNFILILQINNCTQWKATSPAWLAGHVQHLTAHAMVVLLLHDESLPLHPNIFHYLNSTPQKKS